jgi:hypothetical protein
MAETEKKEPKDTSKASADLGGVRTPEPGDPELPGRTRAMGLETATGLALADAEGSKKIPQGKARGSTKEIEGGAPKPDMDVKVTGKATGAQLEPATFVSNGSIEHGTVGSPSGPVPVSTVAATPEAAKKLLEEQAERETQLKASLAGERRIFTEEEVSRMGRLELQAIAEQYDYDVERDRGTRVTRSAFLRAQEEAEDEPKAAKKSAAKKT